MKTRKPSKFATQLAIKLCPPKGWHLDAAIVIDKELKREGKRVLKKITAWQAYLEELDGVE